MKKIFLLIMLLVFFLFNSCEEQELKVPVHVDLSFDMTSLSYEEDTKSGRALYVDKAYLVVNAIELDGRRNEGDDYFFSNNFDTVLRAEMHNSLANRELNFDIPQGVYHSIEMNLMIGNEDDIALRLEGRFSRSNEEETTIVFEYAFMEEIGIMAENGEGSRQIVLQRDIPVSARIIFNAEYMFQLINMGQLQLAERVQSGGDEIILINNSNNSNIFNLLAARLEKSVEVIFE